MQPENTMPILVIEAKGEIISSNFQAFAESVRLRLAEFNLNLRTDEDFDQATADVKVLKGAEDSLKAAKEKALQDAVELNELFGKLDDLTGELSKARLDLSKQIETRKAALKTEMVEAALTQLACDPSMRLSFRQEVCDAFKGLKSFDKMRQSARSCVAAINNRIADCKAHLDEFEAGFGKTMTLDRRNLECLAPEVLRVELQRRFDAHAAAEAAKEAKAKADAEAARLREAARIAEAAKREMEAKQDRIAQDAVASARIAAQPAQDESAPTTPEESLEPSQALTAQNEWFGFESVAINAFAMLKLAKNELKHSENIAAAQRFAVAVNAAWNGGRP